MTADDFVTTNVDIPRLLARLRDQQPAMVDWLRELAELESPTLDRGATQNVVARLEAAFLQLRWKVRRIRGRQLADTLYARPTSRRKDRRLQLLIGHCDTVWPAGTLREMPVQLQANQLRGPGVFDMKGGLTQMMFALRAIRDLGYEPPATCAALVNADEEVGSRESSRTVRRLAACACRAFVLEPAFGSSGMLKTSRKAVGCFAITITGKSAHAGIAPHEGASAILELSHQVQRLFALNDAARGITVNVGTIDGGLRANVVAAEVRASIDVRVRTRDDAIEIEAAIRNLRPVDPRTTIHVEGGFDHPPMEPTPRNQQLWHVARRLGQQLGVDLEQAAVGGASDGNTTSQFTATLDGLGAVGDGAHAAHEYVELSRMVERTALLVLLLMVPPPLS